MEVPGAMEVQFKTMGLTQEQRRLILELWRLTLEPRRLALEPWRLTLEPWMLALKTKEGHPGAIETRQELWRSLTIEQ